MQKLSGELKNAPRDASQVPCSASGILNREETLSESRKVLTDNGSDENQLSGRREQDLRVPVLNMRGDALMPTKPVKARHLLEEGKARVVQRSPFVIQLKYPTGGNKQDVVLGVDAGYFYIGFSAVTDKTELMAGELQLRKNIKRLLEKRISYRRSKRSRKWYREPRFDNRKKKKGWLAPSIQHKLDSHIRLVNQIKQILPITKIIVEVASFDIQKMQNPEISGIEYQQGELQGYNVKQYLLEKFKYKCVYCGKTNIPLEVEQIVPKSRGGSNRVDNLTISCHKCNQKKDKQTAGEFGYPKVQKQAKQSLKATAFMNIVRKRFAKKLNAKETFGYITKKRRLDNNLEKSHINDAFIIAKGNKQLRLVQYDIKQIRRNNRSAQTNRKGYKPSIRRQRYKLQPRDIVKHNGLLCWVKGVFNYGKWVRIVTKAGEVVNTNIKNIEVLKYGKGI
ncbi:MAG: RNA-guided endonuclease IscB, partial [Elusimicrobia bacterium]|nr:RNA-guided endonuclease IscB [Elusimicrobiota bacterium]